MYYAYNLFVLLIKKINENSEMKKVLNVKLTFLNEHLN